MSLLYYFVLYKMSFSFQFLFFSRKVVGAYNFDGKKEQKKRKKKHPISQDYAEFTVKILLFREQSL